MKKFLTFLIAIICIPFFSNAQYGCGNDRYVDHVFDSLEIVSDIKYGNNKDYAGANVNLYVDIYMPKNDTLSMRPLIVLAHGGSFIGGDKTNGEMVQFCTEFAKRGYVTASISYRLDDMTHMINSYMAGTMEEDYTYAVVRAVHDMRAAVRFFRKDAATANTYRINPNMIIVGGSSAGAVAAVHHCFLDDINEVPAGIDTSGWGGIEGNSGNPGYSSQAQYCINLCGAIADTSWIDGSSTPIFSLHGTADQTIPYGSGMVNVGVPVTVVHGSHTIMVRSENVGLENYLRTFPGQDHCPYNQSAAYMDTTILEIRNFLYNRICGGNLGLEEKGETAFSIYPNPASDRLYILKESNGAIKGIRVFNMEGKLVFSEEGDIRQLNISSFDAGLYFLQIEKEDNIQNIKFLKQ